MDPDIAKSLEQLKEKKRNLSVESNLAQECESLSELDRRADVLLNEIRALHSDVDQRYEFIDHNCDKLLPSIKNLQTTDQVLELVSSLTKLNRLCRRLDSSPNFNETNGHSDLKRFSSIKSTNSDDVVDESDEGRVVLNVTNDLITNFEAIYSPLEQVLSKRLDLPYAAYATKIKHLKESVIAVDKNKKDPE